MCIRVTDVLVLSINKELLNYTSSGRCVVEGVQELKTGERESENTVPFHRSTLY